MSGKVIPLKRRAIAGIAPEQVFAALKFLHPDIPQDATFVSLWHDNAKNLIFLKLDHESFDEVPEGSLIPTRW